MTTINTELTTYERQLPDTLEDLSQFLLVAPEKAKALRAEIRAIEKLRLAQEVYDQKMEEQRILAELILDASVKVGELTKEIPKATNGGANQYRAKPTALSEKQKSEAIRDLGFSPKQVERFEKLANNIDLVEQVKAEARESGEIPTRTKVLDLAQARDKKYETDIAQIDQDFDNLERFHNATSFSELYGITDDVLNSVVKEDFSLPDTIADISKAIELLTVIKNKLITRGGGNHGKAKRY